MSHRKRPAARPAPVPEPTLKQRAGAGIGLFVRENVRTMLLFVGVTALAQAFIPWTNSAADRMVFGLAGAVFLGLAVPRRLWR